MGFDAMTLGNHEFNYGQEQLSRPGGGSRIPVLAANVVMRLTAPASWTPGPSRRSPGSR